MTSFSEIERAILSVRDHPQEVINPLIICCKWEKQFWRIG